jgi:transposase
MKHGIIGASNAARVLMMEYVKGEDRNQIVMLSDCLDDYIDEENPVRVIDVYIDSLDVKELGFTKAIPNETGRPMYAPRDLLKLYLYGYMNRVRSSRRLETETKRNLEVIWLMRKLTPDHKTIARFRHDNMQALKNVFRDFVKLCMRLGLYGKELIAIDGSKFKAVNSKDRNYNEKKLNERIARLNLKIDEYMQQINDMDNQESAASGKKSSEEIQKIIAELKSRRTHYQSYRDELKETGETQKSLTDPDSRRMAAHGKPDIYYNVQTAVDSKNKMIVEFEATNDPFDVNYLSKMASLTSETLEEKEISVVADVGYDSASDIAQCLSDGITPHVAGTDYDICLPREEMQTEEIVSHFNGRSVYLPERNVAICPMGKILYPGGYKNRNKRALFYNMRECTRCPCKCTVERYKKFEISMPKSNFTKEFNDENIQVKQIRVTAVKEIVRLRKCLSEHPFGTIKRTMDAGYFLARGFGSITGELSLTFLAYNLKRAMKILGVTRLIEAVQA